MTTARRQFVLAAAGAGAAACVAPAWAAQAALQGAGAGPQTAGALAAGAQAVPAAPTRAARTGANPRLAAFQAVQGQDLWAQGADAQAGVPLRLVAVQASAAQAGLEQFSLVLQPTASRARAPALASGIYRIRHAQLGSFDLYLAPSGPGLLPSAAPRYRADCCLLV